MKLDKMEFEMVAVSFVMPCLAVTKKRRSLNPEWKQSGSSERIVSWADYSKRLGGGWWNNWIPLSPNAGLIFDKPKPGLSFSCCRRCRVYLHMLAQRQSALSVALAVILSLKTVQITVHSQLWLSQVFSMMFCSLSNMLLLFYLFPDVVVIEPTSSTLLQG